MKDEAKRAALLARKSKENKARNERRKREVAEAHAKMIRANEAIRKIPAHKG